MLYAVLKKLIVIVYSIRGFPGDSVVKIQLPIQEMQETQIPYLGWEDPLEQEIATCSSILPWRIPWAEEPCRLRSLGPQRVGHD